MFICLGLYYSTCTVSRIFYINLVSLGANVPTGGFQIPQFTNCAIDLLSKLGMTSNNGFKPQYNKYTGRNQVTEVQDNSALFKLTY